jgi:hypothetical protein
MKPRYSSIWIAILLVFVLTSCVSAKERLNNKFDTLPEVESTLIYEYTDVFSGATGRCTGKFVDRWYGTDLDAQTVSKLYSDAFSEKGWIIWPEEVVEIWSIEGDNGLYRAGVSVYADPNSISQEQADYRLPDSIFRELSHYRTVYLLSMTYSPSSVVKRCFGK